MKLNEENRVKLRMSSRHDHHLKKIKGELQMTNDFSFVSFRFESSIQLGYNKLKQQLQRIELN